MYEQIGKSKENKSKSVANSITQKKSNAKQSFGFVDNRPKSVAQSKMQSLADGYASQSIQKKYKDTGLSGNLKSGIKNLSGYSMEVTKAPIQRKFSVANNWQKFSNTVEQPTNWNEAFQSNNLEQYEKNILLQADHRFNGNLSRAMEMDSDFVSVLIERGVHADTRPPDKSKDFTPEKTPHQTVRITSMGKSWGFHINYKSNGTDWVFKDIFDQSNVKPEKIYIPLNSPQQSTHTIFESSEESENEDQPMSEEAQPMAQGETTIFNSSEESETEDQPMAQGETTIFDSSEESETEDQPMSEEAQPMLQQRTFDRLNFCVDLGAISVNRIDNVNGRTVVNILPGVQSIAGSNWVRAQVVSTDVGWAASWASERPIVYLKRKWVQR